MICRLTFQEKEAILKQGDQCLTIINLFALTILSVINLFFYSYASI